MKVEFKGVGSLMDPTVDEESDEAPICNELGSFSLGHHCSLLPSVSRIVEPGGGWTYDTSWQVECAPSIDRMSAVLATTPGLEGLQHEGGSTKQDFDLNRPLPETP